MKEKPFYTIKNATDERAEIWIYEQIGADWFSEGIEAKKFCQELAGLKVANIDLRINSPGGSVFDGQAIYNALKRHPACVTTYIDGLAASIASVIALAGDRVEMADNALFMIHNPWGVTQGTAEDMRKSAAVLDKCRETILAVYRDKSGLDDPALIAAMDAETWFTAEEAMTFGFVDSITPGQKMAALTPFNLQALGYRHPPQNHTVTVEIEVCVGDNNTEAGTGDQEPVTDLTDSRSLVPDSHATAAQAAISTPLKGKGKVIVMEPTTAPNGATTNQAADIVALCSAHGVIAKAEEFIRNGLTIDQVSAAILAGKTSASLHTPSAESSALDLGKEAKNYSFSRAIASALDVREGKKVSGFEQDIHQELLRTMPQSYQHKGGILVPFNTALTTGGSTTGGELVQTQYGSLIEMLRNTSVVSRLGATFLSGLKGPLTFPKQTGASTLYWPGEAPVADVTESNIALTTVTLTPQTAMAQGSLSRNLILEGSPDAEALIRNDLSAVAALGIDLAALHGSGQSNQPTGVYVAANVNSYAMGGVPTYAKLINQVTECATDNALLGNFGWATTPGMAGKLMQTLVASSAGSDFVWGGNFDSGSIAGYKALASNQVSAALGGGSEHGLIFGSWDQLLVGQWGGVEITVDPYTLAGRGLIRLVLFLMVDVKVRNPVAFCKATGATIS